MLPRKQLSK